MKNILILNPSSKIGNPAFERVNSFKFFFINNGFNVYELPYPEKFIDFFYVIKYIREKNIKYLFISQPPFSFFMLFLIPFVKKIIDYRDGWSIANLHGYGGIRKPNYMKYFIAKNIEKFCMLRSNLIITCTVGLKDYLSEISNQEVILVTNGISKENYEIIQEAIKESKEKNSNVLNFSCAGQFSEYGNNQVKKIMETIYCRYSKFACIINIYGADIEKNLWAIDFIKKYSNIEVILHPRLSQEDLYVELSKADFFISVIRDPSFDYGTKVFEYIAFNKPILNYFDEVNNFVKYFDGVFDVNHKKECFDEEIIRENILNKNKNILIEKAK